MDLTDSELWIEMRQLKDKTIFVGKEASFMVPALDKWMTNKIYLPVFRGE